MQQLLLLCCLHHKIHVGGWDSNITQFRVRENRSKAIITPLLKQVHDNPTSFDCLPVHWSWQTFIIPINKDAIYAPKNKGIAKGLEKDGLMLSVYCACCKTDMIISEENKLTARMGLWYQPVPSTEKLKRTQRD